MMSLIRSCPPLHRLVSTDTSGNGFMLLGESEPAHMENLSHHLRVVSSLFDVLSGQSEVDHPLCEVRKGRVGLKRILSKRHYCGFQNYVRVLLLGDVSWSFRISPQDFRDLRPSISLPLHSSKLIEPNFYCLFNLEYIIKHYLWYMITCYGAYRP